ncbi:hypothetical protein [Parasitella parasitica]|uniref:Reverse transcriptase domain-containing protein n=1 Tax=Parasitella parasitica TaxID=35722 RepID=A0A0B7N6S2_9FUNG|nr:hypothetical protein [Parasitella parasitica]
MDTTLREVLLMIHRNAYLVPINLSDAFLHIGLHSESRRFLRLKWNDQVYQYRTIAFGLSSSPFVFIKVCRPILEHLRSQGIRISAYLDDWLLVADSKELALQQSQMVVSLLQKLGWIFYLKKSVLAPTQQLEHLVFVLDTRKMTAALPLKKLRDIRRSIKQVLDKPDRHTTPSSDPQLNYAHPGSHVCEPDSQDQCPLGHSTSLGSSKPAGAIVVVPQPPEVERSLDLANHTYTNHLCGREQYGLGMQLESTPSPWLLDSNRSGTVDQLARTQSCFSGPPPNFSPFRALDSLDSNGQYYQHVMHQQKRGDALFGIIGTSNRSLEFVSPAQDSNSGTTHQWSEQQDSRHGIPQDLLQEPVDDQALHLPTHTTSLGVESI